MAELSLSPQEKARKAYSAVLQAMQDPGTARNLAQILGVSESTISRTKTEKLEDALHLIYQLGFKVVSNDRVCVDRATYGAVSTIARRAMEREDLSRALVWDED